MNLKDKIEFTRFAMEFEGVRYNVRFPHRRIPFDHLAATKRNDLYVLNVKMRGKVKEYIFNRKGKLVSQKTK
jgi:hypothetical protein